MPPRLLLRPLASVAAAAKAPQSSVSTFLLPFLSQHTTIRSASILSDLRDIPSAHRNRIRVGRGPSSRKGGKSGRGHKGQKQKGKAPAGFNGGQTPDEIVHGKFGFKNMVHGIEMSEVNLDTIQDWINQGRLDASQPITLRELQESRACNRIKEGVKLLGRGATALSQPIHLVVSRASQSAIAAVEALGGTVTTRFYTPDAIRRIHLGLMHPYISLKWDQDGIGHEALKQEGADTPEQRVKGVGYEYRLPDPTGRKDLEYYRNAENRGYLSHTVKEGHSHSLFHKSPLQEEEDQAARAAHLAARKAQGLEVNVGENNVW